MKFNRERFFAVRRQLFKDALEQSQVDGIEEILGFIEADTGWRPGTAISEAAYLLATVKHECANTFKPVTEYGKLPYFEKYEPSTDIGKRLGNVLVGDGWKYRGRGYVQITGRDNYKKFAKRLNMELIDNPAAALIPITSYQIATIGMREGLFTGLSIYKFLDAAAVDRPERADFKNARRVINGLDKADLIAAFANKFKQVLNAAIESY